MINIKEYIADYCRAEFLKEERKHCKLLEIKTFTAEFYQIGYVPCNGLLSVLKNAGYSDEAISILHISDCSESYCFPSRSATGEIVAFYFRRSDVESQPIWHCNIFEKHRLFGIDKVDYNRKYILLCEGIRDAVACTNAGIANAVAATNDDFPTAEQITLLSSFAEHIVAFDSDEAGEKQSDVCINLLIDSDLSINLLQIAGGGIRVALRDLTQRRLIINQIKAVCENYRLEDIAHE